MIKWVNITINAFVKTWIQIMRQENEGMNKAEHKARPSMQDQCFQCWLRICIYLRQNCLKSSHNYHKSRDCIQVNICHCSTPAPLNT